MYKLSSEDILYVKIAAFVDELVKIAIDQSQPDLLLGVADALTPEHIDMLKQAGLLDRLGGLASKAKGAIQGMGEAGVARRMAAAGKEHDVVKGMMQSSALKSAPDIGVPIHRGSGLPKPFAISEQAASMHGIPQMHEAPRVSYMQGGAMKGSGTVKAPVPTRDEIMASRSLNRQREAMKPPVLTTPAPPSLEPPVLTPSRPQPAGRSMLGGLVPQFA